ncbi:NAD(P)-binding protein [Pyxidicoccus caerfyrddinensis]|uniref:NAD(P)-binding protein n=1 Tax=Pyxidicoccus caerfyrddinensis TaxID=2709663 RepID=UPI001966F7F7|nr:NAD(P)-binding protein [Pyxidicoccus caerfyrddinensis]
MTVRGDGGELPLDKTRRLARVHIYGAGIAGLTAAHELARRGFRVRVIESAQECDEMGRVKSYGEAGGDTGRGVAVGGMARTQFVRVEKGAQGNFQEGGGLALSDEYRFFYAYDPSFVPTDKDPYYYYRDRDDNRLPMIMAKCRYTTSKQVGVLHLRTPPSPVRGANREMNAEYMRKFLLDNANWTFPPERVVVVDEEEARQLEAVLEAPLRKLEDQEGLWFEFLHFLPGEHGFRFFPSSYRHLASTMVETPLLDVHGNLTPRRVFDNLVPSSFYGIASQGRRIRFLRRAPATRPVEMLQELWELADSGYPPTDTLQFTLRIWRYLCTSSERRKAEYEKLSWWEYLEGYEPKTGTRRYTYSAAFKRDMKFAPRVLAAFDGEWGDAHTNGNTLAQLYLNNLLPMPKTDGTLNGPTTLAWFRPWRRYLERYLGVEFTSGRLTRFESVEDRLVAWWRPLGEAEQQDTQWYDPKAFEGGTEPVDYYLVATDAATAELVTKDLLRIGVIEKLRGFTTNIPPNPRGSAPEQPRPEGVLPGHVAWDRFQTLTGIQFFFPWSVRLAEGYIYFLDAPWGLSAINSQQYWASPPAFWQDGFGAMLSVDIGNWYVREPGLKSPSTCSREEIAHEVWRQIKRATEQHNAPLPQSVDPGFKLPEPAWYHLDRSIRFETGPDGKERPVENRTPYLIPIVGDWERRPGADPWDPMVPSTGSVPPSKSHPDLWQAPHGGYQVHFGKLVFAGTYLKTFTRMTTMESANESARHAVNAIIDHYLTFHHVAEPHAPPPPAGASFRSTVPEYGNEGSLTGTPGFRMTPIGEYCRIWDPEKHELAELVPLRELDAKLFAAGLPHVWDVLHLEPLVLPLLSPLGPPRGIESLKSFLGTVREHVETMLKGAIPGVK